MENEIEMLKERYAREEEDMKILIGQDISREKTEAKTTKGDRDPAAGRPLTWTDL